MSATLKFDNVQLKACSGSGETIITNIDEDYVTPILTQNTKLYFSPSEDRECDITAGAVSVGTKLFLYHSGSGNFKETVTYATGKTYVMTRKMYAELERVPDGWMFVKESRIGHMDSGMFVPRGAVALNGDLRDKDALWHYITEYLSVYIVTETAWQAGACLKFANYSETQYRLPDWRGITTRYAGANSVLKKANGTAYNGGSILSVLKDMLIGHFHQSLYDGRESVPSGSVNTLRVYGTSGLSPSNTSIRSVVSDGTHGSPLTGDENRPVSGAEYKYIYYED